MKRLEKTLDENQPREQAVLRRGHSTTNHNHVVNQLKEKCSEYHISLCIAFVDYEKAFDSVQTQAVLTSLQEQGIEDVYIELLKEIYTNSSMTLVHIPMTDFGNQRLEERRRIYWLCVNTSHELQQMLQE